MEWFFYEFKVWGVKWWIKYYIFESRFVISGSAFFEKFSKFIAYEYN